MRRTLHPCQALDLSWIEQQKAGTGIADQLFASGEHSCTPWADAKPFGRLANREPLSQQHCVKYTD